MSRMQLKPWSSSVLSVAILPQNRRHRRAPVTDSRSTWYLLLMPFQYAVLSRQKQSRDLLASPLRRCGVHWDDLNWPVWQLIVMDCGDMHPGLRFYPKLDKSVIAEQWLTNERVKSARDLL